MGESTIYDLPYPEDADIPNGPAQIKALADKLDAMEWLSRSLAPTAGVKTMTGADLALSSSYQDAAGTTLEITPDTASALLVVSFFRLFAEDLGQSLEAKGTINLNGSDQTREAILGGTGLTNDVKTVGQVYALPLPSGEKHTIKARAKRAAGTDSGLLETAGTAYLYALFATP